MEFKYTIVLSVGLLLCLTQMSYCGGELRFPRSTYNQPEGSASKEFLKKLENGDIKPQLAFCAVLPEEVEKEIIKELESKDSPRRKRAIDDILQEVKPKVAVCAVFPKELTEEALKGK